MNTLFADAAVTYEDTLDRFASWCALTSSRPLHGRDVLALFDSVVRRADQQPIPAAECAEGGCAHRPVPHHRRHTPANTVLPDPTPRTCGGGPGRGRLWARSGCRLSLLAAHRLGGRGPQREPCRHRGGEQAEDRGAGRAAGELRGTSSGKPVRPRGTPATATATIAAPAPSAAMTVGSISSVDHPHGVAGRAAEQADGRQLVAPFGRGHRRGVDQGERGESVARPTISQTPHAPSTLDAWTVSRYRLRFSGRTPGWSAA